MQFKPGSHTSAIIDHYAKDGRPGVVRHLCSFYREPLRSLIDLSRIKV